MGTVDQPKVIKLILVVLLALTFALCISSFCTANQCLLEPCYSEIGVDQLYRVDGGESLQLVMLSLICFLHVLMAHFVLFKTPFDEMKYGMLVSATGTLGLFIFLQAVLYGQEVTIVSELRTHQLGENFHDMNFKFCTANTNATACSEESEKLHCKWDPVAQICEREMALNTGVKSKFEAVTAFSVLTSIVLFIFSFLLWAWKEEFGSTFGQQQGSQPGPRRISTPAAFSSSDADISHGSTQTL